MDITKNRGASSWKRWAVISMVLMALAAGWPWVQAVENAAPAVEKKWPKH